MKKLTQCLAVLVAATLPMAALADHHEKAETPLMNKVVVMSLGDAADKISQLAGAIPADDYGYMPMEGVASVRGVLTHVSGANFYIAGMLGASGGGMAAPGDDASKADLIAYYEASVMHAKNAIAAITAESMAEEIDMFGNKAPRGRLAQLLADHNHEHLGQLIAYARANHVVPPWSQ